MKLALLYVVLRALWTQDREIGDSSVLAQLARDCGLDGAAPVESARATWRMRSPLLLARGD
jgi:2-hydroxychromene-2-carboxylate isomerase